MAEQKSFKTRVKEEAIKCSKLYKKLFVDYDYLLCSDAFTKADYYIIQGHEDNYRHLTGVATEVKAETFFDKCYDGTLTEDDFTFEKSGHSVEQTKGAVRDKIRVLPDIGSIFSQNSVVEEGFHKNSIKCSFAAEGCTFTLGFTCTDNAKPMTLLRGKKLDAAKAGTMELVIRKPRNTKEFNEIVVGDADAIKKYGNRIKGLLSADLIKLFAVTENKEEKEDSDAEDVCQAERELIKGAQEKAREDERRTIAINLYQGGMTVEKIAETFKCQTDIVKKWLTPSAV